MLNGDKGTYIELLKAARGHATSQSLRIDCIVHVTKNNISGEAREKLLDALLMEIIIYFLKTP